MGRVRVALVVGFLLLSCFCTTTPALTVLSKYGIGRRSPAQPKGNKSKTVTDRAQSSISGCLSHLLAPQDILR